MSRAVPGAAGDADAAAPQQPRWVPDSEVSRCPICDTKFGMRKRKHHCRSCGGVFCDGCCGNKQALPDLGMKEPQRVCSECFRRRLKEAEETHKKQEEQRREEEERAERQRENDEEYVSSIYDTDGLILEILRYLQGGCDLTVVNEAGERNVCRFWFNRQPAALCWADPQVASQGTAAKTAVHAERVLVRDIRDVVLGPFSPTLKKHVTKEEYYRAFTVQMRGGARPVDCVAGQLVDFEAWVLGLAHLLKLDPQWGEPLAIKKEKRHKELDDKESEYLAKYHIRPNMYFDAREVFKDRAANVAHQRWLFDGDMDLVWKAIGGNMEPVLDEHGALLVSKGELRFETELDIFRAVNLWRILAHQHIIFDPEFRPAIGPGSEDPAMKGYKKGELPEPGDPEQRVDTNDGCAYTKQEFIAEYGGTNEWDESEVVPRSRASSQQTAASDLRKKSSGDLKKKDPPRRASQKSAEKTPGSEDVKPPIAGTPKTPAPQPKERGRDVPEFAATAEAAADDGGGGGGDAAAEAPAAAAPEEARKVPRRLIRALVAASAAAAACAAWEQERAARKRERRARKQAAREAGDQRSESRTPSPSFANADGAAAAAGAAAEAQGKAESKVEDKAEGDSGEPEWSDEGRAAVEAILRERAPKKLKKMDKLLREWVGREEELLAALREQYGEADGA